MAIRKTTQKIIFEVFSALLILWSIFLARTSFGYMVDGDPNKRAEFLDPEEKYHLQWKVDFERSRVTFNVTVKTLGWILFGLANNDEASTGKDVVIGGVGGSDETPYFSDRHELGNGGQVAVVDKSQDYQLEQASERRGEGETFLSFSRSLDSCDPEDYPLTDNKVTVIWAYGDSDDYNSSRASYREKRGSLELYILEPEYTPRIVHDATGTPRVMEPPTRMDDRLQLWTISTETRMSSAHTSYLCTIHKAPRLRRKHHVIGFEIHLPDAQSLKHVHHLAVLKCNAPQGFSNQDIFERFVGAPGESCLLARRAPSNNPNAIPTHLCGQLYTIWAIGGRAFFFPPQAGLPLAENPDEYYLVQTHYDNPEQKVNVAVSTHVNLWYTPILRPNDVGLMKVGVDVPSLPPTILVPPKSTDHRVLSHCSPQCTERMFPYEGITVIAALLHSHNSGVRMRLRHFDIEKMVELPWVTYDDNYSNRFQQMRHIREDVRFLPGDQLTVECTYDNTWTNGSVIAGLTTSMCSAFLYYYGPVRDYSFCRSQIVSETGRRRFLGGLESMTFDEDKVDWVATWPRRLAGLTVTQIADHMNWNEFQREELQRFHEVTPQVGSCSRDLFARDKESLRQALDARTGPVSAYPPTQVDTEDDFSGIVEYPFDAKPYVLHKKSCSQLDTAD